jgi:hypothetical protein
LITMMTKSNVERRYRPHKAPLLAKRVVLAPQFLRRHPPAASRRFMTMSSLLVHEVGPAPVNFLRQLKRKPATPEAMGERIELPGFRFRYIKIRRREVAEKGGK